MNYQKLYYQLCESRQMLGREKVGAQLLDSHHIFPKSVYGEDMDEFRVLFTKREHKVAHYLLFMHYWKTYGDNFPASQNMAYAFARMYPTAGRKYLKEFKFITKRSLQEKQYKDGYISFQDRKFECEHCGLTHSIEMSPFHGDNCYTSKENRVEFKNVSSEEEWQEILKERPPAKSVVYEESKKRIMYFKNKHLGELTTSYSPGKIDFLSPDDKPNRKKSTALVSTFLESGFTRSRVDISELHEYENCPVCHRDRPSDNRLYLDWGIKQKGFVCANCSSMVYRTSDSIEGVMDSLEYFQEESYWRNKNE